WLPEEQLLFSCDAFGAHFCADGLFDDEVPDFTGDFHGYFDAIMRPFKEQVREAVAKVEGLDIRMICPSHGPLRRRDPQQVISDYRMLAAAPPETGRKRALLLILSPHGNTRSMAAEVRKGLESRGIEVVEKCMYAAPAAEIRDELERADALVVATPTINRDAPPPVWQALSLISTVTPKGRLAAVLGSYGWSGEAVKLVEERLLGLKYRLAAPGLHYRFTPTAADMAACRERGVQLAEALLG
ncbi:MAG: flavodoxin domain-containing protein, partial [Desulfuromonadaceae bacterium]